MKLAVVHGQSHKGVTYKMTWTLINNLISENDEVEEFFLPKDGPGFCVGCNQCFIKGEEFCPCADKVQPIIKAIENADVVIFDSPNYVMEMSGSMKNLFDHFAYRWVTHRPHGNMFTKIGITICSSAGASASHTTSSMAKQLKWLCFSKVYTFPFRSFAMTVNDITPNKEKELNSKALKIANKVKKRVNHVRPSQRAKIFFNIFKGMQSSPNSAWNPTDRDWWVNQGWTKNVKPWKK